MRKTNEHNSNAAGGTGTLPECFLQTYGEGNPGTMNARTPRRKRSTRAPRRRRGPFADVDLDMLHDTQRLFDWIPLVARRRGAKVSTSEIDRYRVLCAAELAMRVGREPVALFTWIVRRGAWDKLTNIDDDRARLRMHALHTRFARPSREPSPRGPQSMGDVLAEVMRLAGYQEATI